MMYKVLIQFGADRELTPEDRDELEGELGAILSERARGSESAWKTTFFQTAISEV